MSIGDMLRYPFQWVAAWLAVIEADNRRLIAERNKPKAPPSRQQKRHEARKGKR